MTGSTCHPLRRWRVRRFKAITEAEIELAPLTVLVGPNSSGKSSFIQSILLAAQAVAAPDPDGLVALNGPLVQLGDLAALRHGGPGSGAAVALGGTVADDSSRGGAGGAIDWDVELAPVARRWSGGDARIRRVRLTWSSESLGEVELVADRRTVRSVQPARPDTVPGPVLDLAGRLAWSAPGGDRGEVRTVGLSVRGTIPSTVLVRADRTGAAAELWARRLRRAFDGRRRRSESDRDGSDGAPVEELAAAAADRLVASIAAAIRASGGTGEHAGADSARAFAAFEQIRQDAAARGYWGELQRRLASAAAVEAISAAVGPTGEVTRPADAVEETMDAAMRLQSAGASLARLLGSRVLHLGPLRQDPQVLHRAEPSRRSGEVGRKGEHAIALLHRQGDREVLCPRADGSVQATSLREAVEHWMGALGLLTGVATHDRAELGVEARLVVPGGPADLGLTAVGVGVSQLLPVLVMALAAPPGSVLLLEQPELHLHPGVQQRLGDFLLACASSGRQVIVETHSDHLVNRLRRRIAEDDDDRLVEVVRLVLFERVDGRTRLRPLATNRYGGLDDWPDGFFDEGPEDSRELLRAGLRKRGGA